MSLTVLVVDDEPSICLVIRREFEHQGHTVHVAHTALEAAFLVSQHKIQEAIIDYYLPGAMTGAQLGRALRRQHIAVFLISGFSKEHIRSEWRDPLEGSVGFYEKGDPNFMRDLLRDTDRFEASLEPTEP